MKGGCWSPTTAPLCSSTSTVSRFAAGCCLACLYANCVAPGAPSGGSCAASARPNVSHKPSSHTVWAGPAISNADTAEDRSAFKSRFYKVCPACLAVCLVLPLPVLVAACQRACTAGRQQTQMHALHTWELAEAELG